MLNQTEISTLPYIKYYNKKLSFENDIEMVPSNLLLWLLLKFPKPNFHKYINFPQICVHKFLIQIHLYSGKYTSLLIM